MVNFCNLLLKRRRKIVARVKGLPQFVAESLLWRQIVRVGGKAVHIFRNSNGHQRGAALVEFESLEDKVNAMKHCIWYNDIRLIWDADFEKVELVDENTRKKRRVDTEPKAVGKLGTENKKKQSCKSIASVNRVVRIVSGTTKKVEDKTQKSRRMSSDKSAEINHLHSQNEVFWKFWLV